MSNPLFRVFWLAVVLCIVQYPLTAGDVVKRYMRTKEIDQNGKMDGGTHIKVSPDSFKPLAKVGARLTNTFIRPSGQLFKQVKGTITNKTHYKAIPKFVDVADKDALQIESKPENKNRITVGADYAQPVTAGTYPMQCEGNLDRGLVIGPGAGATRPPGVDYDIWRAYVHSVKVDLDMDIDRDKKVDDDKDEENETKIGSLIIADKDKVYEDKDEPALRREVVLRLQPATADTGKVRLLRSSANLKLFKAKNGGADLFPKGKNEVSLKPDSYWLQAGDKASAKVRDHWLKIRGQDKNDADFVDEIKITVLWTAISGHNGLNKTKTSFDNAPIFDGYPRQKNLVGHEKTGVKRSLSAGTDNEVRVRGNTQIDATITPSDLLDFDRGTKITSGFVKPKADRTQGAKADFGFIFRRTASARVYSNGQGAVVQKVDGNDDSFNADQDDDPDKSGKKLQITDSDAPSVTVGTAGPFFKHSRFNFVEYTAMHFFSKVPERCSTKLDWAFTADTALGTNNKAVFILSPPNDGNGTNEIPIGNHLKNLKLTLNAPKITKVDNSKIKRGQDTVITIDGTDLVGQFTLVKGPKTIAARKVQVVISDNATQFSDLKKVKVTFNTNEAAAKGYKLVVKNAKGQDNEPDFEIIP